MNGFAHGLRGATLGGALVASLFGSAAAAQEVTLIMHHFLSPAANAHAEMLEPWAQDIESASEGRISVRIYPAMSMGGKPNELYAQVRDGAADLVWTLLGYTPGLFPRTEVFELPGVHQGSATATTIALNASLDLLAEDFQDIKVLFLHSHDGNLLHSASRPIRSIEDLRGMKLRTPSRTGAWVIEELGAEPVAMPVPALPEAMAKGAVDGALTDFEIVPTIGLEQLEVATTELPEGGRLGTSVFMLAMNRRAYDSLPDDLRAVIDARSGTAVAAEIGRMWEDFEQVGIDALAAAGVERIVLSPEAAAPFETAGTRVVDRWITEAAGRGIDGQALVEAARAAVTAATPTP